MVTVFPVASMMVTGRELSSSGVPKGLGDGDGAGDGDGVGEGAGD